jgi:hypothetical protein
MSPKMLPFMAAVTTAVTLTVAGEGDFVTCCRGIHMSLQPAA